MRVLWQGMNCLPRIGNADAAHMSDASFSQRAVVIAAASAQPMCLAGESNASSGTSNTDGVTRGQCARGS